MSEQGRILPAKDIHRAAKEVVKKAKKQEGKPQYVVMNQADLDDVRAMLRRTVMSVAGVPIKTLPTMPRGKLGIQWESEDSGSRNNANGREDAAGNEGDSGPQGGDTGAH